MPNKQFIVLADVLNVRSKPSTQGNIVSTLKKDEIVNYLETSEDKKWHKIQKNNLIGWSSATYLKIISSPQSVEKIIQIAETSDIADYDWLNRGVAPRAYIKGMALVYGRVYCKLKSGNAAAKEMAKANTGNIDKDALAHYSQEFNALGLHNDVAGVDTLRHLFVLLIGLGMRESSGKHCTGRDLSADNTTAETAEAGLFQTSYNARTASPLMPKLFEEYLANPSGFIEVFQKNITCDPEDLENFGNGEDKKFQSLSKNCPAFAAEFAAVVLRNTRKHWGPINLRKAQIRKEADVMLKQVEEIINEFSLCQFLL